MKNYSKFQVELLDCLINGVQPGVKYSEAVRQFSLTLNYLSGRSYDFVRKIFNYNLPGRSTIRTWYANSDLDRTPGINTTAIKLLEKKVIENKEHGKELVCSLCFDEMFIRQHMQWCNSSKIMLGLSTYGCSDEMEDDVLAKQVIVYMLSVIDERFQIPVAYHFIKSLDGRGRAELLKEVLGKLTEIGVIVINVAFDGYRANATMAKLLGANLNVMSNSFQPYFFNGNGQKIFLMYDNCHLLKLVRNSIGNLGVISTGSNEKIEWSYFEKLLQFVKSRGFEHSHKLTKKHIEFRKNVMKVELAVQTLSSSTAKSMLFLKNLGIAEFENVTPTADFAQTFNDLFDVFNTKKDTDENPFKGALCALNEERTFSLFDKAAEYIKKLHIIENKKVLLINKSTGFRGFIIDMKSLMLMYREYVEEKKLLTSIPTYWLNQDHLENFFGKVRSSNGHNDNPTAQHFAAAFGKLLANDSVTNSKHANCNSYHTTSRSFSNILNVSSRSVISDEDKILPSSSELQNLFEELEKIETAERNDPAATSLQDCTVANIARKIEKRFESLDRFYCAICRGVFERDEKVTTALADDVPCISTFNICKEADRFLKLNLLKGSFNFNTIRYAILNSIETEHLYQQTNFSHEPDHKLFLINEVVEVYIQIKGTHLAKSATLDSHNTLVRTAYRKEVHRLGQ